MEDPKSPLSGQHHNNRGHFLQIFLLSGGLIRGNFGTNRQYITVFLFQKLYNTLLLLYNGKIMVKNHPDPQVLRKFAIL